jgi:hypothetical protein
MRMLGSLLIGLVFEIPMLSVRAKGSERQVRRLRRLLSNTRRRGGAV